jgi:transposase
MCCRHAWWRVIEGLAGDWRRLDERIEGLSAEIEVLARMESASG